MKVGDIVKQCDRVVKIKGRSISKIFGVVIEINDIGFPEKMKGWESIIGRGITILWANGKITKNMAENSLEVIK